MARPLQCIGSSASPVRIWQLNCEFKQSACSSESIACRTATAVDNLGEGKLHNNAVHVLIAIQLLEL